MQNAELRGCPSTCSVVRHDCFVSPAFETGRFAHVADLGEVVTLGDVQRVVHEMRADLLAHPGEWENPTLDRYLDAFAATLDALESLHVNRGEQLPDQPTWRLVAELLVKASGYE